MNLTPRERILLRGYCTGPDDGVPRPAQVDASKTAPCPLCGKRVRVTVRGKFAHHKPAKEGRAA